MLILKQQQFNDEELLQWAEGLSIKHGSRTDKILHWDFGPIMNMKFDPNSPNYLFSQERVPFHWDGAFYRIPKKLLFFCMESNGEGGETFFVDTTRVWNSLTENEKNECRKVKLRYQTENLSHYGGVFETDLVRTHPDTGEVILRLAERVETKLNPVHLTISGVSDPNGFYEWMVSKFYDSDFLYEHHWEKGDLLVIDNYRYLHGRKELLGNKNRTFKRIQIL